tara:strand:- start:77 stop:673 length:597 start_codon:yes stop_codon:yes gene_type:complete
MSQKNKINGIRKKSDRIVEGNLTDLREFRYDLTGGFVAPNKPYTIYFTNDKREIYMTGYRTTTNSKIINKVGNKSIINTYRDLNFKEKTPYPKNQIANPTDDDYNGETITRHFCKIANDNTKPFFEISEDDNNQNSLFVYISIQWRISGTKSEVETFNKATINRLPNGLKRILFPLQLWRPSKNSSDALEKKLERLRR